MLNSQPSTLNYQLFALIPAINIAGADVQSVLDAHPDEVERYRTGDDKDRKKLRGFFMGKVMAATKGRGNPQLLSTLLDAQLAQ